MDQITGVALPIIGVVLFLLWSAGVLMKVRNWLSKENRTTVIRSLVSKAILITLAALFVWQADSARLEMSDCPAYVSSDFSNSCATKIATQHTILYLEYLIPLAVAYFLIKPKRQS